jgi:hypothetical protein
MTSDRSKLSRNSERKLAQYTCERPELTHHNGKSKKAKTSKGKIKDEKIKQCIRNNSAGAWLLCAFVGGASDATANSSASARGTTHRGFMAGRLYQCGLRPAGPASGISHLPAIPQGRAGD